jgi:histidyl-tRNA synthetase
MKTLKGFREFYPDPVPSRDAWSFSIRQWLFDTWRNTARQYGFVEYDGAPLEPLELYTRKSGEEIVNQLYNFKDKGDRDVALRPEMTPTLAKLVSQSATQYRKPLKWFSIPQLFRYERNQKGRLREHFQLNADIIGEEDPGADAELISFLIDVLRAVGLRKGDFVIRISSRTAWQDFYQKNGGHPDRSYDFYQAIDKMERVPEEVTSQSLEGTGISIGQVRDFIGRAEPVGDLAAVVDQLTQRGLSDYITVDYRIIRGLAYYTGVVFEAFDCSGKFRAIAGGGRYDNLVNQVSGGKVSMPALGFGMGDVVLTELLKDLGRLPDTTFKPDIYFAIEDESLRPQSLAAIQWFREQGFSVVFPITATKSDRQFKHATELQSTLLVHIDPLNPGQLTFKNLKTREKTTGPREQVHSLS